MSKAKYCGVSSGGKYMFKSYIFVDRSTIIGLYYFSYPGGVCGEEFFINEQKNEDISCIKISRQELIQLIGVDKMDILDHSKGQYCGVSSMGHDVLKSRLNIGELTILGFYHFPKNENLSNPYITVNNISIFFLVNKPSFSDEICGEEFFIETKKEN